MGKSAGQEVYKSRSGGALWSIACYLANTSLRDGLGAAREYADANDLPWPPPVKQKKVGDFLGTRELRGVIGRVFLPRGVTITLTPEQEREGYRLRMRGLSWSKVAAGIGNPYLETVRDRIVDYAKRHGLQEPPQRISMTGIQPCRKINNRGRMAYQDRLLTRDHWKVIAQRVGYKMEYSGQNALKGARRFAQDEGLPWPIPTDDELPKKPTPGRAYFFRGTGLSWRAIGLLAGHSTGASAGKAAAEWAKKHGLPWPI